MKLRIQKDQSDLKGIFGGHKGVNFTLQARCEITQQEQQNVERYKVGPFIIAKLNIQYNGQRIEHKVSVSEILKGAAYNTSDLSELLSLEEQLVAGCQKLKTYLALMETFGGESLIDI
jgi:hypothetical protein